MDTMQNKCALVHGDLSEYNLLWFEDKVWVIDVSQSVELTHPKAMEFLFRDCYNVCKVHFTDYLVKTLQHCVHIVTLSTKTLFIDFLHA